LFLLLSLQFLLLFDKIFVEFVDTLHPLLEVILHVLHFLQFFLSLFNQFTVVWNGADLSSQ
jgi:hypothetical protein